MHVAVVLNKLFFFNKFSDISYGTCGVQDFKGIFIQKSVNNMYREREGGGIMSSSTCEQNIIFQSLTGKTILCFKSPLCFVSVQ